MYHQIDRASTSLSQRWLSEVEASGILINRESLNLKAKFKKPCKTKLFGSAKYGFPTEESAIASVRIDPEN